MFYVALVALGPLAARACHRLDRRAARVAVCAAGCALLYIGPMAWIAVAHYGFEVPHTEWPVYFGPQARFGGFAAGMGMAVLTIALGDRGRLAPKVAIPLRVAPLVALYVLSLLSADPEDFATTFYHPLSALLWTVLLFATLHVREQGRWEAWLSARWLTGIGLASYSLFVWHEPIMLGLYEAGLLPPAGQEGFPLAVLIVLVVAVAAAVVSYWVIEYPASLLGRLKDAKGQSRDFYPEVAR